VLQDPLEAGKPTNISESGSSFLSPFLTSLPLHFSPSTSYPSSTALLSPLLNMGLLRSYLLSPLPLLFATYVYCSMVSILIKREAKEDVLPEGAVDQPSLLTHIRNVSRHLEVEKEDEMGDDVVERREGGRWKRGSGWLTVTLPESMSTSPNKARSRVDFPAPTRPTTPSN
jgi:hypothetical protein